MAMRLLLLLSGGDYNLGGTHNVGGVKALATVQALLKDKLVAFIFQMDTLRFLAFRMTWI